LIILNVIVLFKLMLYLWKQTTNGYEKILGKLSIQTSF